MAYKDLREWIQKLEDEGELARVKCEVDWDCEIGAVARETLNRGGGPALLFENITDHKDTWCTQTFVNSMAGRAKMALALGLPKDTSFKDITHTIKERIAKPSGINILETGPVKENIITGDDINLNEIPVPQWRPEDGGRYINTSCAVVTRSKKTGLMNVGTYRGQIVEDDRIGTILAQTQHWGIHYKSHKDEGYPEMPVAIVLGWDPTLEMLAGAPLLHPGMSEYEYVSALRQEDCDLVKCETNDLLVPATAEIVVEGYISSDPATFRDEGPFGEYTGYMGGERAPRPTIHVTAITHRNNPIFRGTLEGTQPHTWAESAYYTVPCFSAVTWNLLETVGIPGIMDVWANPVTDNAITKVRINKAYRGHAKQVANAIWGSSIANYAGKIVMIFDEDVDIHDYQEIEHALSHRLNASMGQLQTFEGTFGSMLDPSVPLPQRDVVKYGQGKWTRIMVDATINWDLDFEDQYGGERFPQSAVSISPGDHEKVLKRWDEYGITV